MEGKSIHTSRHTSYRAHAYTFTYTHTLTHNNTRTVHLVRSWQFHFSFITTCTTCFLFFVFFPRVSIYSILTSFQNTSDIYETYTKAHMTPIHRFIIVQVLNFLTAYINYGGRVTDYTDLRTLDVIMKGFFNPGECCSVV